MFLPLHLSFSTPKITIGFTYEIPLLICNDRFSWPCDDGSETIQTIFDPGATGFREMAHTAQLFNGGHWILWTVEKYFSWQENFVRNWPFAKTQKVDDLHILAKHFEQDTKHFFDFSSATLGRFSKRRFFKCRLSNHSKTFWRNDLAENDAGGGTSLSSG